MANTQVQNNTRRQMSTVMKFHQVPSDTTFFSAPDRFLAKAHLISMKQPPPQLLNGTKWDLISESIWNKFRQLQQSEDMYKRRMNLWRYLFIAIKVRTLNM